MAKNARGIVVPVLFFLILSAVSAGRAQPPLSPTGSGLTVAAIDSKIKEIEASEGLDEGLKAKVLEVYKQALSTRKSEESHAQTAANYREAIKTAPERIQRLREELEKAPAGAAVSSEDLLLLSLDDLRRRLTEKQAELLAAQNELSEHKNALARQRDRPAKVREELATAKQALTQVEENLKAPAPAAEDPLLTEARRVSLAARKRNRETEIEMLDQELLSHDLRTRLVTLLGDEAALRVRRLEAEVKALEERLNQQRRIEAEQTRLEAERERLQAFDKHPAVRQLADENAELSRELTELTQKVEETTLSRQNIQNLRKSNEQDYENAKEKLALTASSDAFGQILAERRRALPDIRQYRRRHAQITAQMSSVALSKHKIEEMRRDLGNLNSKVEEITAELAVTPEERAEIDSQVRKLLHDRVELLGKLSEGYQSHWRQLESYLFDELEPFLQTTEEYADFLDKNLLWTPNTPPIGLKTLKQTQSTLLWLLSWENWSAAWETFGEELANAPVLSAFIFLFIVALILCRRLLVSSSARLAERVGKVRTDGFLLTLMALLYALLFALPLPLFLVFVGWRLHRVIFAPDFTKAVGLALVKAGILWFFLDGCRALCRKQGLALVHFRWRQRTAELLRQNLFWLICLLVPAVFVVATTEWPAGGAYEEDLGRLTFMLAMFGLALFAARVLPPRKGVLEKVLASNPLGWLSRLRHLWYGLSLGLPLLLAVLAACGYYYTALQLSDQVGVTLFLVVAAIVVYNLILRWLVIARTRLALARAREKREAARAEVLDPETGEDLGVKIAEPTIDLATIDEQTRRLVRALIGFSVLVGLFLVWADVLPALGMLDVELWAYEQNRHVTLAALLLFLVLGFLTIVAARNLPGVLELSILRRLPLDSGSRYAIMTIGQYVIVVLGVVLAFNAIHIGWSRVQWLVAALSVGLGFGLQEIFANFVSGLIILIERPIRVGDTVTVGTISGTVTRIRIRATTITDWDRKELVVPNKNFITGELVNWSLSDPITRLVVIVGIAYGSDTNLALKLMLEAAKANPATLEEPPPSVFFVGFGDSALNFEVRVFTKELTNFGRTKVIHELHLAIDNAFRAHGVVIAFPQRDLHIKSDERLDPRGSAAAFEKDIGL